jgi:hypothetical protein
MAFSELDGYALNVRKSEYKYPQMTRNTNICSNSLIELANEVALV